MNTVVAVSSLLLILSPLTSAILTQVTCSTSGSGTCANPYCNLTPNGSANFGCGNLTIPLNSMMVSQKVNIKTLLGLLYVPLAIFPDFEYCAIAGGAGGLANSIFSVVLRTVAAQNPGFIHPCPYKGTDFQINNFSLGATETLLGVLVSEYTMDFRMYNSFDSNVFTVTFVGKTHGLLGIDLGITLLG